MRSAPRGTASTRARAPWAVGAARATTEGHLQVFEVGLDIPRRAVVGPRRAPQDKSFQNSSTPGSRVTDGSVRSFQGARYPDVARIASRAGAAARGLDGALRRPANREGPPCAVSGSCTLARQQHFCRGCGMPRRSRAIAVACHHAARRSCRTRGAGVLEWSKLMDGAVVPAARRGTERHALRGQPRIPGLTTAAFPGGDT